MQGGDEIVGHLRGLEGADLAAAEKYARCAPAQVNKSTRRTDV